MFNLLGKERDGWWRFLQVTGGSFGSCWCSTGESQKWWWVRRGGGGPRPSESLGLFWTVGLDVISVAVETMTTVGVMPGAWMGGWLQRLRITVIKVWIQCSYLKTLCLCVWKAGTYLESRLEVLSIQAFIDEPVGLGLTMCLMFDQPGAETSSLACDSLACSSSGA